MGGGKKSERQRLWLPTPHTTLPLVKPVFRNLELLNFLTFIKYHSHFSSIGSFSHQEFSASSAPITIGFGELYSNKSKGNPSKGNPPSGQWPSYHGRATWVKRASLTSVVVRRLTLIETSCPTC